MDLYSDLVLSFGNLDYNQKCQAFILELESMVENMEKVLQERGIKSDIETIDRNVFGNFDNKDNDNYLLYSFALLKKIESQISDFIKK